MMLRHMLLKPKRIGRSDEYDSLLKSAYESLRRRRYTAAIDHLLIRASWCLKPIARQDGNHSWYVVGDIFWHQQKYQLALRAFQKAARCWPEDAEAQMAIGNCHAELNRPKLAERFFRRSLELAPSKTSVKFNLANALFDQAEFAGAIQIYRTIERSSSPLGANAKRNRLLAQRKLARNTHKT
jgi:tetratricopeptide (TPR) repeat protein